mmetsp:Transcript_10618/g.22563  ORF Transcript_10618/g.22563 Transcript_10618/m.22563 type:complete len:132 (+) Transcript_10618:393-788(+)
MRRHTKCHRCGVHLICSLPELRAHQQSAECVSAPPACEQEACDAGDGVASADAPGALVASDALAVREAENAERRSGCDLADAPQPQECQETPPSRALGKRSAYECETCGKVYLFTSTDILRHERGHTLSDA